MKNYVVSIIVDFEAESPEEAAALMREYVNEAKNHEFWVEELDDRGEPGKSGDAITL